MVHNFSCPASMCPKMSANSSDANIEKYLSCIGIDSFRECPISVHFSPSKYFQVNMKCSTCIPPRINRLDLGNALRLVTELWCTCRSHQCTAIHGGRWYRPVAVVLVGFHQAGPLCQGTLHLRLGDLPRLEGSLHLAYLLRVDGFLRPEDCHCYQ